MPKPVEDDLGILPFTTRAIAEDVMGEGRATAKNDDVSTDSVVTRSNPPAPESVTVVDRGGLPVFDVPTDAPTFGPEQVRAALDE